MRRDERVWIMGQDVGRMGGVFGVTRGLFDEFGPERVRDTTINETFIVGGAAGAAMTGTIPVVELQFADFLLIAGDEVFHKLAKWRYMHGGKLSLPVVVRLPTGVARRRGRRALGEPRGDGHAHARAQGRPAGDARPTPRAC